MKSWDDMNIESIIQTAVSAAFPLDRPFLILRESGLVAHLRCGLLQACSHSTVLALLQEKPAKPGASRPKQSQLGQWIDVFRVQQELRIDQLSYAHSASTSKDGSKGRTDIVVLAPKNVQLERHDNGPGDVVAWVNREGAQAAIEVKACPAADGDQLLLIMDDIVRLFHFGVAPPRLNDSESVSVEAHMVVADKSADFFCSNWWSRKKSSPIAQTRVPPWFDSSVDTLAKLFVGQKKGGAVDKQVDAWQKTLSALSWLSTRPPPGTYVAVHLLSSDSPNGTALRYVALREGAKISDISHRPKHGRKLEGSES